MEASINLRVGVYITQPTTLNLVRAMLAEAEHHILLDDDSQTLTAYLETILDHLSPASSSSCYDLLILGPGESAALCEFQVLQTLSRLLALRTLPIILLTDAAPSQIGGWLQFPLVAVLPEHPLPMPLFFQTLGQLAHFSADLPQHTNQRCHGQLLEMERKRIAARHRWLEQRQEWLEQRQIWLDQRHAWLEARGKEHDPQHEWLSEQRIWLEQQRSDVEEQQKHLSDLRWWLRNYQNRIDEEQPPSKRSQQ
ncbi:MAG TPA: hypothetical protein VKY19_04365 [Ktedonosporobacter sp.]|nr:hypothetical protein [Ktedonosporobacter sp.]